MLPHEKELHMRTALLLGIFASSVLLAFESNAGEVENQIVDATDPGKLVSIIQNLGYRAKLEVDADGDPMIRSSVGGTQFAVVFYGCSAEHDECQILLFKAGYDLVDKVGMEVINQWNATRLFGRAYLDDIQDPWLEMVLNVNGGVTRQQFETTFEWWESSLGEFEDEIGV
jgi:hypothetical protein